MIPDRAVASLEHHVADLALAEVAEHALRRPADRVAMLLAARTGEHDDDGVPAGRVDAPPCC